MDHGSALGAPHMVPCLPGLAHLGMDAMNLPYQPEAGLQEQLGPEHGELASEAGTAFAPAICNTHSHPSPEEVRSSRYIGVSWHAHEKQWMASIQHQGRSLFLGMFGSEEEACRAFDRAAIGFAGTSACTNFPVSDYYMDACEPAMGGPPAARPRSIPRKEGSTATSAPAMPKLLVKGPAPPQPAAASRGQGSAPKMQSKAKGSAFRGRSASSPRSVPARGQGQGLPARRDLPFSPALEAVQRAIKDVMNRSLTEVMNIDPLDQDKLQLITRQEKALEWVRSQGGRTERPKNGKRGAASEPAEPPARKPRMTDALLPMHNSKRLKRPRPATSAPEETGKRFKGVRWMGEKSKWRAELCVGQCLKLHIGYFNSEEEAARAHDRSALEHFGLNTVLNFPLEEYFPDGIPGNWGQPSTEPEDCRQDRRPPAGHQLQPGSPSSSHDELQPMHGASHHHYHHEQQQQYHGRSHQQQHGEDGYSHRQQPQVPEELQHQQQQHGEDGHSHDHVYHQHQSLGERDGGHDGGYDGGHDGLHHHHDHHNRHEHHQHDQYDSHHGGHGDCERDHHHDPQPEGRSDHEGLHHEHQHQHHEHETHHNGHEDLHQQHQHHGHEIQQQQLLQRFSHDHVNNTQNQNHGSPLSHYDTAGSNDTGAAGGGDGGGGGGGTTGSMASSVAPAPNSCNKDTSSPASATSASVSAVSASGPDLIRQPSLHGVYYVVQSGRYRAMCWDLATGIRRKVAIGEYGTEEEAARAYDQYLLHSCGTLAGLQTNFPPSDYYQHPQGLFITAYRQSNSAGSPRAPLGATAAAATAAAMSHSNDYQQQHHEASPHCAPSPAPVDQHVVPDPACRGALDPIGSTPYSADGCHDGGNHDVYHHGHDSPELQAQRSHSLSQPYPPSQQSHGQQQMQQEVPVDARTAAQQQLQQQPLTHEQQQQQPGVCEHRYQRYAHDHALRVDVQQAQDYGYAELEHGYDAQDCEHNPGSAPQLGCGLHSLQQQQQQQHQHTSRDATPHTHGSAVTPSAATPSSQHPAGALLDHCMSVSPRPRSGELHRGASVTPQGRGLQKQGRGSVTPRDLQQPLPPRPSSVPHNRSRLSPHGSAPAQLGMPGKATQPPRAPLQQQMSDGALHHRSHSLGHVAAQQQHRGHDARGAHGQEEQGQAVEDAGSQRLRQGLASCRAQAQQRMDMLRGGAAAAYTGRQQSMQGPAPQLYTQQHPLSPHLQDAPAAQALQHQLPLQAAAVAGQSAQLGADYEELRPVTSFDLAALPLEQLQALSAGLQPLPTVHHDAGLQQQQGGPESEEEEEDGYEGVVGGAGAHQLHGQVQAGGYAEQGPAEAYHADIGYTENVSHVVRGGSTPQTAHPGHVQQPARGYLHRRQHGVHPPASASPVGGYDGHYTYQHMQAGPPMAAAAAEHSSSVSDYEGSAAETPMASYAGYQAAHAALSGTDRDYVHDEPTPDNFASHGCRQQQRSPHALRMQGQQALPEGVHAHHAVHAAHGHHVPALECRGKHVLPCSLSAPLDPQHPRHSPLPQGHEPSSALHPYNQQQLTGAYAVASHWPQQQVQQRATAAALVAPARVQTQQQPPAHHHNLQHGSQQMQVGSRSKPGPKACGVSHSLLQQQYLAADMQARRAAARDQQANAPVRHHLQIPVHTHSQQHVSYEEQEQYGRLQAPQHHYLGQQFDEEQQHQEPVQADVDEYEHQGYQHEYPLSNGGRHMQSQAGMQQMQPLQYSRQPAASALDDAYPSGPRPHMRQQVSLPGQVYTAAENGCNDRMDMYPPRTGDHAATVYSLPSAPVASKRHGSQAAQQQALAATGEPQNPPLTYQQWSSQYWSRR